MAKKIDGNSHKDYDMIRDNAVVAFMAHMTPRIVSNELIITKICMADEHTIEIIVDPVDQDILNRNHFIWFNCNNLRWKTDIDNIHYKSPYYAINACFGKAKK